MAEHERQRQEWMQASFLSVSLCSTTTVDGRDAKVDATTATATAADD